MYRIFLHIIFISSISSAIGETLDESPLFNKHNDGTYSIVLPSNTYAAPPSGITDLKVRSMFLGTNSILDLGSSTNGKFFRLTARTSKIGWGARIISWGTGSPGASTTHRDGSHGANAYNLNIHLGEVTFIEKKGDIRDLQGFGPCVVQTGDQCTSRRFVALELGGFRKYNRDSSMTKQLSLEAVGGSGDNGGPGYPGRRGRAAECLGNPAGRGGPGKVGFKGGNAGNGGVIFVDGRFSTQSHKPLKGDIAFNVDVGIPGEGGPGGAGGRGGSGYKCGIFTRGKGPSGAVGQKGSSGIIGKKGKYSSNFYRGNENHEKELSEKSRGVLAQKKRNRALMEKNNMNFNANVYCSVAGEKRDVLKHKNNLEVFAELCGIDSPSYDETYADKLCRTAYGDAAKKTALMCSR